MDFIPNSNPDFVLSLVTENPEERVDFICDTGPYHGDNEHMHKVSNEATDIHVHPCVWSISREDGSLTRRYSSEIKYDMNGDPFHFGIPKVIISIWQQSGIPYLDIDGEYAMTQHAAAIRDDIEVLPLIRKAMESTRFRDVMKAVRFTTDDWNKNIIELLRKDFWREFIDTEGNLLDANGNVISDSEGGIRKTT